MSRQRVTKALKRFGLSSLDVKVYIYLSKTGPQSKEEISKALKIKRCDVDTCVKHLWIKKIIAVSMGDPIILCAFPFETVLEILIKNEMMVAKEIKERNKELFSMSKIKDCEERKAEKF